ncbi:ciliogenesis-associated TTC17-interacting protein isoform X3 [Myotis myotis]|uniref:Ciliogenesis-associated TTC17-interacting protein n=1 Tax=Myotis myotis TaxID=51298 RepID=A0A7J7WFT4_MYOMY|nr:ciliogenesis-associated TTC17-interacting protein isoform X3 [Myotis myotis]KAF6336249.1 ciliogenesis associated TTC17 interacting protein [Myotis myotis]
METAGNRPGGRQQAAGSMSSKVQSKGLKAKDQPAPAPESLPPPEANAEAIHFLDSLSYLTWNLETVEQHSQEFVKFHILPMEQKTSLLRQGDQLAMTRSIREGEEVRNEVTFFPWHSTAGFISQAANLLLLRVMAWRQMVPSNARFLALDMEGKFCYSTYKALGSQTIQVDRQQADAFIVEQTVHSVEGIPFSCQFYLLSDGHLAKRVQVGSPGCCIITKMPVLREEDEIEPRPVFEKKPLAWEEDIELHSRFLERKEELRLSHTRYLQQHPDGEAIVSDFLLFLLLRQPEDVVTFAAEFFGPFSLRRPPTPSLRSSAPQSPFRSLDPRTKRETHQARALRLGPGRDPEALLSLLRF